MDHPNVALGVPLQLLTTNNPNYPLFSLIELTMTPQAILPLILLTMMLCPTDSEPIPDPATALSYSCLLYTSPSPRDGLLSRMPSSA